MSLAIIGGSGLYALTGLKVVDENRSDTPFGRPSGPITAATAAGGGQVLFLNRHGPGHRIPPHSINYRANLWALRELGAKRVVAVGAVGAIARDLKPGDLVLPTQLIDYTWGREGTFGADADEPVRHIDFTNPFDDRTRELIEQAARQAGIPLRRGGVYAATQGPRLETAAEIDRLERDGATLVGMTAMPEAALARELDLPYALLAAVVNAAAGRGSGSIHADIERVIEATMAQVDTLLAALVAVAQ